MVILNKYTVKVLHKMHAGSLESTKSNSICESWTTYRKQDFCFTSKLGEISLILSSVQDFDKGLLGKYIVKVLYTMHSGRLGGTKFKCM